jgi:hypothetical protein
MWFGTRAFMQEVATPRVLSDYSRIGWEASTQYENGRRGIAASVNAHGEFFLDWGFLSREGVRQITDYASGVYGTGLLYWIDPVAADQNVLPQAWATPSLAGYDAIPLAGDDRPVLSANTDQSQGYPVEKATYTLEADTVLRPVYVPIPPGHVAWVGVHGDAGAQDRVKVTPFTGATAGTVVHPTILSVSTTTRVNTEVEGTGLELSLDTTTPGDCPIVGMIVQILPDGQTPATGRFISGQGHAGCRFEGRPNVVPFVIDGDNSFVQVSGKLVEVG